MALRQYATFEPNLTWWTSDLVATAPAHAAPIGSVTTTQFAGSVNQYLALDAVGTWGKFLVSGATATAAFAWSLLDNSATALVIAEGVNNYFAVITTNNAELIEIGSGTGDSTGTNPTINLKTNGPIMTNGTDFGTRYVLVEQFTQRPQLVGVLANPETNKNFELSGTNAVSANVTLSALGGVTLTTAGAGNDQMIVRGTPAAGQSTWGTVAWLPSSQPRLKVNIRTLAAVTTMVLATGFKLTVNAGMAPDPFADNTDANQAFFGYATDARYGATAGNWYACIRIAGVSANVNTGVVVAINTNYRMVIDVSSTGIVRFYLNGVLVATSAAMTAAAQFIPFAGCAGLVGARAFTLVRMAGSIVST